MSDHAALHDAYAADYDAQVQTYDCHIADLLFGLCYEFTRPDQRLLDAGIGTGLSAQLFAQAGLTIYGTDFSPDMLNICRAKGFAAGLKQHDLLEIPWPYPSGGFEIFSHAPAHIETLLAQHAFTRRKMQKCFVGDDLFLLWIAAKH